MKRRVAGLHQLTALDSVQIVDTWEPIEEGLKTWALVLTFLLSFACAALTCFFVLLMSQVSPHRVVWQSSASRCLAMHSTPKPQGLFASFLSILTSAFNRCARALTADISHRCPSAK